ncbi:uncharacterized protein M6B38_310140 [Iris pallida]|uniref:Uncharacterized protein n=1 Tax=Iris pallida TaxID=29817 RepID=A0AAX6HFB6_IRIPA|nr:uncharacterized protein M6B38_316530 [Iris pallida]KAJ6840544.1 uncharacterized protein M6B38_310140 [Iris pallida]
MAGMIFKFLPKAASFSIPNHNNNKYMFSGPIVPVIPDHRRRKSIEIMLEEEGDDDREEEPTSPKVSCMGQVRNHKKTNIKKTKTKKESSVKEEQKKKKKEAPKRASSLGRLFWRKARPARRGGGGVGSSSDVDEAAVAPDVRRMRRYASRSRRETLKDFDWRTISANEAAEEALVPHSAPMLVVGGAAVALEPKKEINIWMRRARAPPIPLQLN